MTLKKAWLAAGIALMASTAPVLAADWGGIRDIGGGVATPVPAPAPVPTFDPDSDWYVGLTLGANISQSSTIVDTDKDYLGNSTPGNFGLNSDDVNKQPIFGLNFGRYITPSLRAEIAVDYSPNDKISNDGNLTYSVTNSAPSFNFPGSTDTNHYLITRSDTAQLSRTTGLVNLIYDINTGTRFTPYIGAGFGFSWRKIKRSYSETDACLFSSNPSAAPPYPPNGGCAAGNILIPSTPNPSGSDTTEKIDFAAAVQAGIAYNITDSIIWDNGWQMLWESDGIASTAPSASGENTIVYKDAILQQFRSGLRFKFN